MTKHRKITFLLALLLTACSATELLAQSCYWVFFTDKHGSTFNPYTYFDSKAIERYKLNNADLYDSTNYPLNTDYVAQVNSIAIEEVGQVRWFNAMAVMATAEEIATINRLPFVARTQMIASDMQIASAASTARATTITNNANNDDDDILLTSQLKRMGGQLFKQAGIDGKGLRIAVFDGGFPRVNTHRAFNHLRKNNQIIATWNFPNKQENVYGWNSHGTMVLSCIAGMDGEKQMGLATGATFLLARTEIEPEPFKEEVWWCMAVEWADKNGADIINSSLGYGKDRYFTHQMDGRSYVAHAANMAARKGILVCNSAGNEGDDKSWKTIITPGDADSILTVGGINASLSSYTHISFSSYGPTADGRMKPNVCNFGQAEVASPSSDNATSSVYGTSFSSPLTAGFCACAWQTRRNLTAMQMKKEVEQSADLYPYFDYAYGYGVPQAKYFLNNEASTATVPTFTFEEKENYVLVKPTATALTTSTGNIFSEKSLKSTKVVYNIFFKITNRSGLIDDYANIELDSLQNRMVAIPKGCLVNHTLTVHFNGYTQTYELPASTTLSPELASNGNDFSSFTVVKNNGEIDPYFRVRNKRSIDDNKVRALGNTYKIGAYLMLGNIITTSDNEVDCKWWSPNTRVGIQGMRQLKRNFAIGLGLEYGATRYRFDAETQSVLDYPLPLAGTETVETRSLIHNELSLELFERWRIVPAGIMHNGLFWDLGIYGSWGTHRYIVTSSPNSSTAYNSVEHTFRGLKAMDDYRFNWGLTTRITYDMIGIYARYRLGKDALVEGTTLTLPRLQVGLMLYF